MSSGGYTKSELQLYLKRSLTSEEFRYYNACLRYMESKTDLDRNVWFHIARGLGVLLGKEVIKFGEEGGIGERVSEVV